MRFMDKVAPSKRHCFTHEGRAVYEWDQTFSEVNIYVVLPQGVRAKQLDVAIGGNHLSIGIKGNPPYLDVGDALFESNV